jgi:hypothetical protein
MVPARSSCHGIFLFPAFKPKSGKNSTYTGCPIFPSQLSASGDWQKRFPVFGRYNDDPFDYHAEDEFLTDVQGAPSADCHFNGKS